MRGLEKAEKAQKAKMAKKARPLRRLRPLKPSLPSMPSDAFLCLLPNFKGLCISQAHGRHQKSQQRWANSFGERPGIARP